MTNMINETLNKKIFSKEVEKKPIRNGFGEGLLEAGEKDDRVVALCADLTESTRTHLFAEKFPERFIEVGIAEQNLASTASGMAAMGKTPFATSYAIFSPGRNWEQIRTTICYNNQPVILVGSHAGVTTGPDGGTHQALEDISISRSIPNMIVVSPCDCLEAKKATLALANLRKPAYLRLHRNKSAVITTSETPFEIGKGQTMFSSKDKGVRIGLIATGQLVYNAIRVADRLDKEGIGVEVLNISTIKPIDKESILALSKKTNLLATIEEHQIIGGLGSAVAEVVTEENPVKILRLGINDEFGQSGESDELLKHYKLDIESIYSKIKSFINK